MLSPRPFSGYASLQGTKGAYDGLNADRVCLVDLARPHDDPRWRPLAESEDEFLPTIWRTGPKELEQQVHGGADGLSILEFVNAISATTDAELRPGHPHALNAMYGAGMWKTASTRVRITAALISPKMRPRKKGLAFL
jgi:hypothetical protein